MDTIDVHRLRRSVGYLSRRLNSSDLLEGLAPSQASALSIIALYGPMSLARLAEIEGANPTMLSRVVSQLVKRGLISRTPDSTDRRSAWVEVQPPGKVLHEAIKGHRDKIVAECIDRLPAAYIASITEALPALEMLVQELQQYTEEGHP